MGGGIVLVGAEAPPPTADQASAEILLTAPVSGEGALEAKIRQMQQGVDDARLRPVALAELGWLFIAKARQDGDSGLFLRARAVAEALGSEFPRQRPDALLLQGHVHHQLHEFEEAKRIARELVASRGGPFDFALLGDALLDEGELEAAVDAYQKMMDLRPGLPAYLRAGEARWLRGDVKGSLKMMRLAASAGSTRQPEAVCFALSRLSHLLLQSGSVSEAAGVADRALALLPGYVPALAAKGRALLAQGAYQDALEPLSTVADLAPQPAHQWALWECLTALDRAGEADAVREKLVARGRREDPRTLALFLATTGGDANEALRLARHELTVRHDIYTHDALAWALHEAEGGSAEALEEMNKALAEGTKDARLYLHAAAIAASAGQAEAALGHARKAEALRQALLPTEAALLTKTLARVASPSVTVAAGVGQKPTTTKPESPGGAPAVKANINEIN